MNYKKVLHFSRNRNFLIYSALSVGIIAVLLGFIIQYSKAPESVEIKKILKDSCPWLTHSELDELIDSLTSELFVKLREFFDNMPSLKHVAKYTCKTCGEEKETTIQGIDSFFGSA
mgnify:CR=1 FL=1